MMGGTLVLLLVHVNEERCQRLPEPDRHVCMLHRPTASQVLLNVWVGVAPSALAVYGQLETSYCITVAGRDGKLYNIK